MSITLVTSSIYNYLSYPSVNNIHVLRRKKRKNLNKWAGLDLVAHML